MDEIYEEDRAKRILVLGSVPATGLVTGYRWDQLPADLNVADFDVVILDFVPLLEATLARRVDLDALPSASQFARLLFSDSQVLAVGSPDTDVGDNPYQQVTWWLPAFPEVVSEAGEAIRDVDPDFLFYFQHVKRYSFYVGTQPVTSNNDFAMFWVRLGHSSANDLGGHIEPLAETRFGNPIAFQMQLAALKVAEHSEWVGKSRDQEILAISAPIFWLPPPTEIPSAEAIDLLLSERFGVRAEGAAPPWVSNYPLPREQPVREEIQRLETEIRGFEGKLAEARDRLRLEARFKKLLFEQGEDVLEPVVRDAFEELDADVDPPQVRGREDGRLVDPRERKAILEIKGRAGALRLSDVRELDQWVRDALLTEGYEGKGILVFNPFREITPEERGEPFPPNCLQAAKLSRLCLMTTTQLFRALVAMQEGTLDLSQFWEVIFRTEGRCGLPELASTG